jgi:hypothetical protein
MICDECQALYEEVGDRARDAKVFQKVRRTDLGLFCRPLHTEAEATYLIEVGKEHDLVWVGLQTPDRWLNESIEADLVNQGDKIEELLEEELIDQGFEARLPVEHFRNEAKQFVFRSPVFIPKGERISSEAMVDRVAKTLLAYEQLFRELGDVTPRNERL